MWKSKRIKCLCSIFKESEIMGFLDRFKGKDEGKMVKLKNGKYIPLKDVYMSVVKVYDVDMRKWNAVPPDELEEGEEPVQLIEKEDIDDLNAYQSVRCDLYNEAGKRLGIYWQEGSITQKANGGMNLSNVAGVVTETINQIDGLRDAVGGREGREGKQKTRLEELKEMKEEFELYKSLFGGGGESIDRKDYPLQYRLITDPEFRVGVKSLLEDSVKSISKSFMEGVTEGQSKATTNQNRPRLLKKRKMPGLKAPRKVTKKQVEKKEEIRVIDTKEPEPEIKHEKKEVVINE